MEMLKPAASDRGDISLSHGCSPLLGRDVKMGGSSSSVRHANAHLGALRIHLDNSEVASGHVVRGTIGLVVYEQINVGTTLNIESSGDMEVHFFTEDRDTTQRIPLRRSHHKSLCVSAGLCTLGLTESSLQGSTHYLSPS
jgi:hypothetical protein